MKILKSISPVLIACIVGAGFSISPTSSEAATCGHCARDTTLRNLIDDMNSHVEGLIETLRLQSKQETETEMSSAAAEANMKQLEDARQRQLRIDGVKFKALNNASTSHQECVIRTRVVKNTNFHREDRRLNTATLDSLAKLAAWRTGSPVGPSGSPLQGQSPEQKEELYAKHVGSQYCDPARQQMGLCSTPASAELQGADYLANVSILSSDNYNSEAIEKSCVAYIKNLAGAAPRNAADLSASNSANSAIEGARYLSKEARVSLASSIIQRYCSDRSPTHNRGSSTAGQAIEIANKIGGYDDIAATGPSWLTEFKIYSQEWYWRPDDAKAMTEINALNKISGQLGWMIQQNLMLYKKMDELNVLNAAQLMANAERASR